MDLVRLNGLRIWRPASRMVCRQAGDWAFEAKSKRCNCKLYEPKRHRRGTLYVTESSSFFFGAKNAQDLPLDPASVPLARSGDA